MITDGLIWLSKWTAAQVYFCCVWALQHILLPAWPYFAALLLLTAVRLFSILPARRNQTRKRTSPSPPAHLRRIGAVLGSGGHTSEMLTLLSHLDVSDGVDGEAKGATSYAPPHTYFISRGDTLSAAKARSFESNRPWTQKRATQSELQPSIVDLPRARRVHQPLLTTPFSVLECFAACLHYTLRDERTRSLDLIVMNGPGTCVPLVAAVYVKRLLGLASPQLLYVESFARVKTLSMTGKILRHFVDRFVVQWPTEETDDKSRVEYHGWLV